MFIFPNIDPVALSIGSIEIRWYGLSYLLGFLASYLVCVSRKTKVEPTWSAEAIGDLLFYVALGVILGGRVGYILFYDLPQLWQAPWQLFAFWAPGRSFHGGLLGVLLALWLYCRKHQRRWIDVTDFIAPSIAPALGCGRIGNFLNGELVGRATDVSWAMVFPHVDNLARHATTLYEAVLEGLVLFAVVLWFAKKPRLPGQVSGVFLLTYGVLRFGVEFFREPDGHLGLIGFNWLTMGQLLCIPMIILGWGLYANLFKFTAPHLTTRH